MAIAEVNVLAGWIAITGGIASGTLMGLYFHRDDSWMGEYASMRRRMLRLGHVAFFGLGFMNLAFAFTVRTRPLWTPLIDVASIALVCGAVAIPLVCLMTAWKAQFRHAFPIPVACVFTGVTGLLAAWWIA